ncbi:MAG TPA: winged helix DNA-binding domain-containing protein [Candidatus Dormibacteraeota bacterium]
MKSPAPVAAELSWQQVHAFRVARHHLAKRAPTKDLARVVGDIGGVQAQVMSAAELQVAVRADCSVADVRAALWNDKKLVKTWLMRGTLHLLPAEDLPLFTASMHSHWVRTRNAWLTYVQLDESEFTELIDAIGQALDGQALTREELIARVGKGRSERVQAVLKSGWGGILKPVARSGLLCFGPSRGQSVTFVRPRQWLGSWREVDPDAALVEVARRYLRAYGPATKNDFARWFGTWSGVGKAAWEGLAKELVTVSIEGRRADLLAADLKQVSDQTSEPSVRLLPNFDPYLLGHANRDHLFASQHRARVSRTAGWISAVVLLDGRVVATWTYAVAKRTLTVTVDPFRKLSPSTLKGVRASADSLAAALGLVDAAVRIA